MTGLDRCEDQLNRLLLGLRPTGETATQLDQSAQIGTGRRCFGARQPTQDGLAGGIDDSVFGSNSTVGQAYLVEIGSAGEYSDNPLACWLLGLPGIGADERLADPRRRPFGLVDEANDPGMIELAEGVGLMAHASAIVWFGGGPSRNELVAALSDSQRLGGGIGM